MPDETNLQSIRTRIDAIDEKIINLINERAQLAKEVATIKRESGAGESFYRPEREAQVLSRALALNGGPLPGKSITTIIREIMSACLALEQPLLVAYLGPEGTFTHEAALKHFGQAVTGVAKTSIEQVFREVESETCHYGVIPVENSTEGFVNQTLDLLSLADLTICGEVALRIRQNLLSNCGQLEQIKTIYAHQQSFAQCRNWLTNHLPHAEQVFVDSNAAGARQACAVKDGAAIASVSAASQYHLKVLASNIEDIPNNTTRFFVLGNGDIPPSGDDKTSIVFTTQNVPGALHGMLSCFAKHGIGMTRIESRPSKQGLWDYIFFVDITGHRQDNNISKALAELKQKASSLKILGSYPRSQLV